MTPQQIALVKKTWVMVVPIAEKAAELFYGRLFELEPSYRALFRGDMSEQGNKLVKTIDLAVGALDDIGPLTPTLKQMGADHAGYGVVPRDYDVVGAALIWTLQQGLGDDFSDEVKNAWGAVYEVLANTMKAGADAARAA